MKWHISFSKQAKDFMEEQFVSGEVADLIQRAIKKFQGEDVSVDIKKMKGEWADFYRIRKGKWRIIASFYFKVHEVYIEAVDWRGNIY